MMLRAKILLLWLLTLAIPVQGFAAVLQACAPAVARTAASQLQQPPPMMHHVDHADQAMRTGTAVHPDHHDHQDHQNHQARHDQSAARLAAADPAAAPSAAQHDTHHASASCSYCAACTVGAVLPLALSALPVPHLPPHDYLVMPAAGFVGHLPEHPDRPPALA